MGSLSRHFIVYKLYLIKMILNFKETHNLQNILKNSRQNLWKHLLEGNKIKTSWN